jgi:hypothetical protein
MHQSNKYRLYWAFPDLRLRDPNSVYYTTIQLCKALELNITHLCLQNML